MTNDMMLLFALTVGAIISRNSVFVNASDKPNIIMLVIDDLGHNDHNIYGSSDIPMKNLENLAKEGIILSNYYTQTVCSPTRSSLMTGRYPFRMGMQHISTLVPGTEAHLPTDTKTIAEILKEEGYATSAIGKWHLGYSRFEYTPTGRGFDSHVGYFQGQVDYFNKTIEHGYDFWSNRTVLKGEAQGAYSLHQYVEEYHRFLENHKKSGNDAPFFMYLAHQTVHVPLDEAREGGEPECSGVTDHWRHVYCSMLVELDNSLADLVSLLKDLDYWSNTYILTTTDNGGMTDWSQDDSGKPNFPASIGSNFPLRSGKTSLFEGGVRGTAFLSGGALPQASRGTSWDVLMHAVDLSITAMGLAGATSPSDVDGLDFSKAMRNHQADIPKHSCNCIPFNIVDNATQYSGIRFGDMKLIVGNGTLRSTIDGYWKPGSHGPIPAPARESGDYMLFNITADPTEHHDIASENPTIVSDGLKLIRSFIESGNYMEPQRNIAHVRAYPAFHDGTWAPFQV